MPPILMSVVRVWLVFSPNTPIVSSLSVAPGCTEAGGLMTLASPVVAGLTVSCCVLVAVPNWFFAVTVTV
jgi:hypothetical protein